MKKILQNIGLLAGSLLLCLLIFEAAARFFIRPCDSCYGVFLGHQLPPFKAVMYNPLKDGQLSSNDNNWWNRLVVDGSKITLADLRGSYREDSLLGYTHRENFVSPNRWWQTNNLGARSRDDTPRQKTQGKKRIILFGESFTDCIGLRQEEAWPFLLDKKSGGVEVIDFAVGGYSMAECFLRYKMIKEEIDYDAVVFVFSPSVDLWREINVVRYIGGDWTSHNAPSPRFIIEDGRLKLIKIPWEDMAEFYRENRDCLSEGFRRHLRAYDRFYFWGKYEEIPFIGKSILFKLIAARHYNFKKTQMFRDIIRTDCEAVRISKKIFQAVSREAQQEGRQFILVFFPPPRELLRNYRISPLLRRYWKELVPFICEGDFPCIDLMGDFLLLRESQLDIAYDGEHYGPAVNRFIAELLWENLKKTGSLQIN